MFVQACRCKLLSISLLFSILIAKKITTKFSYIKVGLLSHEDYFEKFTQSKMVTSLLNIFVKHC